MYLPDPPGPDLWCDVPRILARGTDDCDGLASWRMGELLARGWRALQPGDAGYAQARRERPARIPAQVFLTTRTQPGQPGMHHAVVRYRVGARWHSEDPSARLGMRRGRIAREVAARWARAGIAQRVLQRWSAQGHTFVLETA